MPVALQSDAPFGFRCGSVKLPADINIKLLNVLELILNLITLKCYARYQFLTHIFLRIMKVHGMLAFLRI
jgi:hypothetical protein